MKITYEFKNECELDTFYHLVEFLSYYIDDLAEAVEDKNVFYYSQIITRIMTDIFGFFSPEDFKALKVVLTVMTEMIEREKEEDND